MRDVYVIGIGITKFGEIWSELVPCYSQGDPASEKCAGERPL